ncbi:MAG: hypothetical protein F4Y58_01990, partial [Gammaproteobacteria bacterium]|nr:hypothetical protein [Gammaproteobacteria bacterium]
TSLRMFLMIRNRAGEWQSSVCGSPNDAVRIWKAKKQCEGSMGILHIAYDLPPYQDLDSIADQYSGRILITAPAKYTLPTSFTVSRKPVAFSGDFAVYLALHGWGYSLKDPAEEADDTERKPQNWLVSYIKENPRIIGILAAHKIYNDASYLNAERRLDPITRQRLGMFRAYHLVGANCKDPCKMANAVPPWLAKRKLTSLNITTTAFSTFKRNNLETVADLASWTPERLLKEPYFGYKSLYSILICLEAALNDIPMSNMNI